MSQTNSNYQQEVVRVAKDSSKDREKTDVWRIIGAVTSTGSFVLNLFRTIRNCLPWLDDGFAMLA